MDLLPIYFVMSILLARVITLISAVKGSPEATDV